MLPHLVHVEAPCFSELDLPLLLAELFVLHNNAKIYIIDMLLLCNDLEFRILLFRNRLLSIATRIFTLWLPRVVKLEIRTDLLDF